MTPSSSDSDQTCVVTGSSSGIGAEIARVLAGRGRGVTLVARRRDRLDALADELRSAHGVRVEVVAVDLTDADARAQLPGEIEKLGLHVAGLVNNAGFSTTGRVHEADRDQELLMLRTNIEAVADLCRLFLPGMIERGAGAILNVASIAAFQPLPGQAGYAASKSFVLSYTHALRGELKGTGVTATALCPGPVKTEFIETAGFEPTEAEHSMPSIMWVEAAEVARQAVAAMEAGRAVVIPGVANRVSAAAAHLAPRSLIVSLVARQHPALRSR